MLPQWVYTIDFFSPKRLPTHKVLVGDLPLGSQYPIRIQSMVTANTMDTKAVVEETLRLVEQGCEIVRITAPNKKAAEHLAEIKKELRRRQCKVPLVADIHYTPSAALVAAKIVEKVRINPGNYVDKKRFQYKDYSEAEWNAALERIYERFAPLVKVCKEHGTALRIGVNHGSLSDRILSRYGDTPQGMVESAWEFLKICEDLNFDQVVLSMKASDPRIMVHAYRLLAHRMLKHGKCYPIHLGVTEAGSGLDGRMKSAIGIATLLAEGIGDTIRVSLAEPAEAEIPVAKQIVQWSQCSKVGNQPVNYTLPYDPYAFNTPRTIFSLWKDVTPWIILPYGAQQCDMIWNPTGEKTEKPTLVPLANYKNQADTYPLLENPEQSFQGIHFVALDLSFPIERLSLPEGRILVVRVSDIGQSIQLRGWLVRYWEQLRSTPVVLRLQPPENLTSSDYGLWAATIAAPLLIDKLIQGIWLEPTTHLSLKALEEIAQTLLQSARLRITQTEYIACPSCGRTLFDLQTATEKIKKHTKHLKGLKIAIMGCIVNGPGEMADADYGYVGAGPGRIHLYRGKTIVRRNVPEDQALQALIELIKSDGKWHDPC